MDIEQLIGTRIREYAIIGRLGQGGMAAVLKAKHLKLDAFRAIKVVRGEWATQPDYIARFKREARLLSKLKHNHLVQIHDFFEENGQLFLVMEYLSGETLAQRMKTRKRLNPEEILPLIIQALSGLEDAHANGIIHRDLSPGNLMLTKSQNGDDRVVIIDFGIAKAMQAADLLTKGQNLTATGKFLGKPEYSSPEQAMGFPIDHRSDLFSMGLILFRSLTGVIPFRGDTPKETLLKRRNLESPRLNDFAPDLTLPSELENIVRKSIEQDPARRFQTASEFRLALKNILPENVKITDVHRIVSIETVTGDAEETSDTNRHPGDVSKKSPDIRNILIGVLLAVIMVGFGIYLTIRFLVEPDVMRTQPQSRHMIEQTISPTQIDQSISPTLPENPGDTTPANESHP